MSEHTPQWPPRIFVVGYNEIKLIEAYENEIARLLNERVKMRNRLKIKSKSKKKAKR